MTMRMNLTSRTRFGGVLVLLLLTGTALLCMPHFASSFPMNAVLPRSSVGRFTPTTRLAAAPGVTVASPEELRHAMQNPATTVVDARTIEELLANGYFTGCESHRAGGIPKCRWVHAPSASPTESPLLLLASASLLPDLTAPVIVHCGSGIRASGVQTILKNLGYTTVLNAGGLTDLEFALAS